MRRQLVAAHPISAGQQIFTFRGYVSPTPTLTVRDLLSAFDQWQVPGDLPALTPTGVAPPA